MTGKASLFVWPTLALVAQIFAVLFTVMRQRLRHVATNPPTRADFANGESERRYFAPVQRSAHNLANLSEMPMLYFVLVLLFLQAGVENRLLAGLAWVFVLLRLCHSVVHIKGNRIRLRFRLFLASTLVLAALWIAYAAAMAGIVRL